MDVAVSVLIKLVIDIWLKRLMFAFEINVQEMLSSPKAACRVRAFDLILNLGVHGHLLEPMMVDGPSAIEEEYSQEAFAETDNLLAAKENRKADSADMSGASSANDNFESWILNILYEIILLLVQVIKTLIEVSRMNSWAELVHSRLVCMLTNMCYQVPDGPTLDVLKAPVFLIDQVDLIGGIEFILYEYSLASLREDRRNLYLVLFDYVLHQINEACIATGVSEYSYEEIQPLSALLSLADAPEAFYISVKFGVEGIGELLRRSVSTALSRYSNNERLNMLLENITEKLDTIIERIAYRQNGYTWLGDLLIAEISDGRDVSVWLNIKNMQHKIARAGVDDSSVASDVPLSIWLMCGLLKSKDYLIRWGFLYVLERLLMRCKILLDENEVQQLSSSNAGQEHVDNRLEKANAVIDIMSSALSLLAGAVADNISLGVAVGSKGRGNFPGAASDIRATLLLLLIGKCTADCSAFQEVGGEEFFRTHLDISPIEFEVLKLKLYGIKVLVWHDRNWQPSLELVEF
ncbi:hypothetical protein GH714_035728 [Hevea brasiliensis]|uniref:Uncharacterized protein n=1 Tax=Hevea brasiliensis TaxID=3981 RepID=A0A6A6L3P1_HEVBR|nr:hypothetical protein GH714_035728 [Hevea brasiliensis]